MAAVLPQGSLNEMLCRMQYLKSKNVFFLFLSFTLISTFYILPVRSGRNVLSRETVDLSGACVVIWAAITKVRTSRAIVAEVESGKPSVHTAGI